MSSLACFRSDAMRASAARTVSADVDMDDERDDVAIETRCVNARQRVIPRFITSKSRRTLPPLFVSPTSWLITDDVKMRDRNAVFS